MDVAKNHAALMLKVTNEKAKTEEAKKVAPKAKAEVEKLRLELKKPKRMPQKSCPS